jgi:hypothetical protein
MADISVLSRLVNGFIRNVDLTNNTLVMQSIKIGTVSPTELTKTILDNLVSLQNGSDISASLHHHDGRYYTETEIGSSTSTSGSDLVGDDNTYSNFTPAAATVKGALSGIDTALGSVAASSTANKLIKKAVDFVGDIPNDPTTFGTATYDGHAASIGDRFLYIGSHNSGQSRGIYEVTGALTSARASDMDANDELEFGMQIYVRNGTVYGNAEFILRTKGPYTLGTTVLDFYWANENYATEAYVNNVAEGLRPKEAVRVATTANITLSGPQTIDGVSAVAGNRVLVKDQNTPSENGIYVVAAGAWARATDFDSLTPIDEVNRAYVAVQEGTANAGKVFIQYGTVTTLGSDAINFTFYNSSAGLVGGDGITITGMTIDVDHDGEGLTFASNQLALELDGSTLSKSSAGVKVASGGITNNELASNSVTTIKIQDGAVNSDKLATNAVSTIKIADDAVTRDKINADVAGAGLSQAGSGALQVDYSPLMRITAVAGESFAANTAFAVRWARTGETAGRVYKATNDASVNDNFYVIGLAYSTTAVNAGDNITVVKMGSYTFLAGDPSFAGADIGKPVFLTTGGNFDMTAPTAANTAVVRIGVLREVNIIDVMPVPVGVN